MKIRESIARFLRVRGFALIRYPMKQFLDSHNFDLVLDVGANVGQYGTELRTESRYRRRIVSFEPMAAAFAKLSICAKHDPLWTTNHCGLGQKSGKQTFNVSGNSASSSMFDMLPAHSDVAPNSAYVTTEEIRIAKLDDVFDQYYQAGDKVLLKIDTQGYELEVLKGAMNSLPKIGALQLELSLSPLYKDAPLFEELIGFVRAEGFVPYWFMQGFRNCKTQQLLQMDGLFIRAETVQ